ncbi:DEAD/DEAH box helicase family protein [Bifidobacterium dentium]|uniref:type III restriction-modification system endonuclease n=1 Tax=Bifidobacterium dentium TaxID=1689 RepID=UPI0018B061C6|nr:DEAD/DEAH box helicase family protein [Bifidobacterium dentium]MBF9667577.1 DEAD/DEAH box helicase family protein [Bifidobacterium dentium]
MKFRFSQYQYQSDAADAVCDVFEGQPLRDGVSYIRDMGIRKPLFLDSEPVQESFDLAELRPRQESFDHYAEDDDTGYRNVDLLLSKDQLLSNARNVQRRQNLAESTRLYTDPAGAVELDVEMETGTGKTFVYTKTMFELNRRYGWSKFIIVVPSIAIREGVAKSLDMTEDYFYTSGRDGNDGYGKRLNWFVYDSSDLTKLDNFAQSPDISAMIINMQAFNTSMKKGGRSKDANIIFSKRDNFGSRRPIDVISATHPIMILDEPQKMGGKATQEGIRLFKPLFTLNYSATHKTKHDLVYALDALDAYNQRLVKRIEVKGFELNNMRGTDGYLYLQDIIVSKNKAPQARIEYKKLSASGKVVTASSLFNEGDDIYTSSGELEAYRDGWRIAPDGIVPDGLEPGQTGYVRFMNGETLGKGQILNDGSETDMRRIQIRETILSHLHKEEHLWARGIKCLSLFFIDEVAKYRRYDDSGEPLNGEYADIFEQEYDRCVHDFIENRLDDGSGYLDWLRTTHGRYVHKGYFSIDKHGHSIDSKVKRGSEESDDISAYDLILKNKERLLSFDEPTRFIFSHSALREGWDNPNVFQICTLKHSDNEVSKRQEVGRGLRLCVNRDGVRQDRNLLDDADFLDVNLLTVIASESYEKFAEGLQKDIETDLRDRPLVIDDAFFTKTHVSADKLDPEYAYLGDVSFSKDEAHDIVYALTVNRLIDRNGKLTDKYEEDRFGKDTVELLPEPLQKKAPAIRLVLDSVVEGTTRMLIGNALKRKVHGNPLNGNWQRKEFQELWKRINHKYAYTVSFDDDELVRKAVEAIDEHLIVSKLSYTVTRGIQKENASRDELADRTHFHRNDSHTGDLDVDASNGVKYDLLGEIAQAATITRRCAARILKGIRPDRFLMFKDNPEQFIAKVGRLIVQEKANMVVDHICYDRLEGGYDSNIFTAGGNNRDEAEGYQASKCVQDWVFPDGKIESNFAKDLDNAAEVAVYAKLPRGFQIPTPVGNYAPDWAVAFRDDSGLKHLFFVAETKGTLESFDLRGIENSKIACAKRLFNELDLADGTHYEQVTTYQTLLNEVKALR